MRSDPNHEEPSFNIMRDPNQYELHFIDCESDPNHCKLNFRKPQEHLNENPVRTSFGKRTSVPKRRNSRKSSKRQHQQH
eukprot:4432807-Pyramimonas_sp.AAC.1